MTLLDVWMDGWLDDVNDSMMILTSVDHFICELPGFLLVELESPCRDDLTRTCFWSVITRGMNILQQFQ